MTPDELHAAIMNLPCHTAIEQLIEKWRDDCPKDQPSLSDFNDGKMVAYSLCITDLSILLAALPVGWQPIASAPKDGTEFLAWHPDTRMGLTFWNGSTKWYSYHMPEDQPTHWMPLPLPPTETKP